MKHFNKNYFNQRCFNFFLNFSSFRNHSTMRYSSLKTRLLNKQCLQSKLERIDNSVLGKISSFNFSSSESDFEKKRKNMNQAMLDDEIFAGPIQKNKFGILKALFVIICGIYFGSLFAAVGANMLEELQIFVRDDEDDD